MLILARKEQEDIFITAGEKTIIVKVVEIRGDKVRLGFTADADVAIDRAEIHEAKLTATATGDTT